MYSVHDCSGERDQGGIQKPQRADKGGSTNAVFKGGHDSRVTSPGFARAVASSLFGVCVV